MKEEHKTSKALKGQLLGAISMMLVAAIALGTSTYAWFINNQAVELQKMELTVSASTSLLAAVGKPDSTAVVNTAFDAAKYTPYKTVLLSTDITDAAQGNWTNFFSNPLIPASVCDAQLKQATAYPTFYQSMDKLTDGKVSDFTLLAHDTSGTASPAGLGIGSVKHLRLAFKSSADLNVYFGRAAGGTGVNTLVDSIDDLVTAKTGAPNVGTKDAEAQAAAIRSVLRVAIVPQATAKITGALAPKVFQFDDGAAPIITNGGNNTYYPAGTVDTDTLFTNGTQTPDPSKVGSAKGVYTGIVDLNSTKIKTISKLTAMLPNVSASSIVTIADPIVTTGKTELFQLKANEDRVVDIYIWLDGTDEDCLNELAQYNFCLSLPFAGAPTTP